MTRSGVARRIAGSVVLAAGTLAACGHAPPSGPNAGSAQGLVLLNGLSATQVVSAIAKAGLPALNPHDVTGEACQQARCSQAMATDTVTVLKFPTTGSAQRYAGSITNAYQIEDLVLVFAPTVTADLKRDYEKVVAQAAV